MNTEEQAVKAYMSEIGEQVVRAYMSKIGSKGGSVGRGDAKRRSAAASWTEQAREKRRLKLEQKRKLLSAA